MLFLDGVYVDSANGSSARFRWVKAPTSADLTHLTHTIAQRVGRCLERQGLLERDAANSYLSGDAMEAGPLDELGGHSITYRIAAGPQAGRKVFTLQTLPECNEPFVESVGKVAGFSLHAGVAANERKKLERLCRYIARPAVTGKAAVAAEQWPGALRAQDAVPRWHHACHLRADGLHCATRRAGA